MAATRTKPPKSKRAARNHSSARLEMNVTPNQKALIERAASYEGRTLTEFMAHVLVSAAADVVERYETMRLNPEQSRAFLEALFNPAPPNEALLRAAREWKRTVESR